MIQKLFIGDITTHLSDFVQKQYPKAVLCTSDNFNQILNNYSDIIVYTSLGDLKAEEFNLLIKKSSEVIFSPPNQWTSAVLQQHSEEEIFPHTFTKEIKNFQPKLITVDKPYDFFNIWDLRKSNDPQLWICGDSNTEGISGQEKERYGNIISKQLNLPVSFLAKGGARIRKITDQILRADIRKGDTVIVGLNTPDNTPYKERNIFYYIKEFINKFDIVYKNNVLYDNVICLEQIKLRCQQVEANLYFVMLESLPVITQYVNAFYDDYSIISYIGGYKTYLDYAADNSHPGPLTHRYWAEQILSGLK
jgi:hypothetical protein